MGVLYGTAMMCDSFPYLARRALKSNLEKTRVPERALHYRDERPEEQAIPRGCRRRRRAVFRPHPIVAFSEKDCAKSLPPARGCQRVSAGQPQLDACPRRLVHACQACRQRGRVIRNEQIPWYEMTTEVRSGYMGQVPSVVDDEQLCITWTLDWQGGGTHAITAARPGSSAVAAPVRGLRAFQAMRERSRSEALGQRPRVS